jgi:3,4-dihydroxy 2-butanone 4-phosphate synthase/GTP cyclohydrolase II
MARRQDLEKFAAQHNLRIGTIADLIRYRIENEKTVERASECEFERGGTKLRLLAYRDALKGDLHFALVKGAIDPDKPVLVRVHLENPVYDLTTGIPLGRRWPMHEVLERLDDVDEAVLVVLCNQFEPGVLLEQMERIRAGDGGRAEVGRNARDYRTIGLGSQILADLGVRRMRVLSSPIRFHALSGFGLEIVEYIQS